MIAALIIILILLCYVSAYFTYYNMGHRQTGSIWFGWAIALSAFFFMAQGAFYFRATNVESDLTVIDNKIVIAQNQVESVIAQLTIEVDKYLGHESKTIGHMTPEKISLLLIQYPQLKGNETIRRLMESIESLNKRVYDFKFEKEDMKSTLYFMNNTSFVLYHSSYNGLN